MKSLVSVLHLVALGIFDDAEAAYPSLRTEFTRDRERLSSLTDQRGLGLYTLDLPGLYDLLVAGLESKRLTLCGPLSSRVSKRVLVPKFLRGLWLRVFDRSGSLRLDPDINAIVFLMQILCNGKKIELPCTPARNEQAIKEFIDVEKNLPYPTLQWDTDKGFDVVSSHRISFCDSWLLDHDAVPTARFADDYHGLRDEDTHLLERLDTICRDVSASFGLFDAVSYELSRLYPTDSTNPRPSGTKNGPGAVSDLGAKTEKFVFSTWPDKLQSVFPIDFFGHRPETLGCDYIDFEHPSKLHMVPKTAKGPRLIASEPSYHQWCQQLVRAFLEDGINSGPLANFISFKDQSKSHPMVITASRDGSFATIDLSSASDRLSCWAIERAFAGNLSLLDAFKACRTRVITRSKTCDIEPLLLKKFSTMGSALTFPVQSLFFLMVCFAALPGRCSLKSMTELYKDKVRIYGDDIIIPVDGYARTVRLLTLLGLKANLKKSFSKGNFRESCGLDAYKGYIVTPIKPHGLSPTSPEGRRSMIDYSNNLFRSGFWKASAVVRALLPRDTSQYLPVVGPHSGALGIVSFVGSLSTQPSRWNSKLQRMETLCTSFSGRVQTTYTEGTDYTYQALHSLHQKCSISSVLDGPSRNILGRVVKAVTRERRSWVDLTAELCLPLTRETRASGFYPS